MDHLLNIVKEFKNLDKQVIQKIYNRNELDKACLLIIPHILIVKK